MNLSNRPRDPVVWMNVTTSANWNRPPVGIVRVEQALSEELGKIFGPERFRQCIWMDGEFVEWIPKAKRKNVQIEKAIDIIFPRLQSFDIPREFLARALFAFQRKSTDNSPTLPSDVLEVSFPLTDGKVLQPTAGDVLISVGLDWDQPYTSTFYSLSNDKGIKIITCCYDLIPVLFPQYCVGDVAHRFKDYFNVLTWGSSAVLCISEQTKRDYISLCSEIGAPERPTCIIPLGDNVPAGVGEISDQVSSLIAEPFILFVSTIERRKNHEVLYRAYHSLSKQGHKKLLPKLIFVGMVGWGVGDLLKDIELDPLTNGLIIQLNHVSDAELSMLYTHALFCVYPSLYEGWGLPVGEALAIGKAVLASDQGSLPEVGGDLVRYLDPWNSKMWADAILELLVSPHIIKEMEQKVVESYVVRTWADAARSVGTLIDGLIPGPTINKTVLYPGYDFSTQVGLHFGACIKSTGKDGFLMFGPHRHIKAGTYRVDIFDLPEHRAAGRLTVDFVGNGGNTCFWQETFDIGDACKNSGQPLVGFDICVVEDVYDYEIRFIINSASVTLSQVVITKRAENETVLYPGYDFSTQVGRHFGACIKSTGEDGFLMFGPHRHIKAGSYRVEIFDLPEDRAAGRLTVDFVGSGGNTCFWQETFDIGGACENSGQPLVGFDIFVVEDVDDYEIRFIINSASVTLSQVVITKRAENETVLYPGYDFSTQVGLHFGACIKSTGKDGFLMFGPRRHIKAGSYRVEIFDLPEDRAAGRLTVDFVASGGNTCFWRETFDIGDACENVGQPLIGFDICVVEDVDDYEIRFIINAASVTLSQVVITRQAE